VLEPIGSSLSSSTKPLSNPDPGSSPPCQQPSTPVRLPRSSPNALIPGVLESSNRALLDGTNPYSISRRSPNVSVECDGIPQTIHPGPFRQCCIDCLHSRCDRTSNRALLDDTKCGSFLEDLLRGLIRRWLRGWL
jgi:hypothetical protein